MRIDWRDVLGGLAALALGLAAFFVLIGWTVLIPTNIAWLNFADRAMHTLGWFFFREASWGNPPGISPDLGIELSNSIGLVDGLPLFALPFKLIRDWLPQPFQYWGYWLLLSFTLQSWFAYRIARELGAGRLLALIAAAFAIITPAFMFRVGMHLALSGHWTVLAALFLYVRREPPSRWMWPLLATLTAGIHAYLLALVLGLWFASIVERLWSKRMDRPAATLEAALVLLGSVVVLWLGGFFVTGTIGSYGYGDYKLNLLWPILPYKGWSQIIPDIPHTKYDYEGLSFLGVGILGLLALSLVTGALGQLRSTVTRRWLPLAIMLVLMMLFAITTNVAFADIQLVNITLPKPIEDLFATFRSTGRFIWPLLYFITIGTVVMVARRLPLLLALPIAIIALAVQAFDSGPQLLLMTNRLAPISTTWDTPLKSEFWDRAAAAGFNRIRVIPIISGPGTDWRPLGYYAVTHHMDIDSAYLGRMDERALLALRAHEDQVLKTGDLEPHTLYVVDRQSALTVGPHLQPGDLLAVVDDRIVVAKDGYNLVAGLGIDQLNWIAEPR